MIRLFAVAIALAAASTVGFAGAPTSGSAAPSSPRPDEKTPCPLKLGSANGRVCTCSPGQIRSNAPIWGDETYSDDSSICRAARHAGVIGVKGGVIFVEEDFGRPSYPGTTKNGVKSLAKGGWQRSISFAPPSTADLPADNAPAVLSGPASFTEGELNVPQGNASSGKCPANALGYKVGETYTCTCTEAVTMAPAAVWGINPYTADSALCRAARHSSVIAGGGTVTFTVFKVKAGFRGDTRRGVATESRSGPGIGFVF